MAVWCTKQSLPPFSGVMKPNPFASLNHFTVPVIRAICALLLACTVPAASRLALTPPLNGGTFIETFLLHVLKQARFGDLTVELLQHHFQPIGLVQGDFHRPIQGEKLDQKRREDRRRIAPGPRSVHWCPAHGTMPWPLRSSEESPERKPKSIVVRG